MSTAYWMVSRTGRIQLPLGHKIESGPDHFAGPLVWLEGDSHRLPERLLDLLMERFRERHADAVICPYWSVDEALDIEDLDVVYPVVGGDADDDVPFEHYLPELADPSVRAEIRRRGMPVRLGSFDPLPTEAALGGDEVRAQPSLARPDDGAVRRDNEPTQPWWEQEDDDSAWTGWRERAARLLVFGSPMLAAGISIIAFGATHFAPGMLDEADYSRIGVANAILAALGVGTAGMLASGTVSDRITRGLTGAGLGVLFYAFFLFLWFLVVEVIE